jgi:hypothetical protein
MAAKWANFGPSPRLSVDGWPFSFAWNEPYTSSSGAASPGRTAVAGLRGWYGAEVQNAFDAAMQAFRGAGAAVEDPVQGFAFPTFDAMMWYRRFRHDFNDYLAGHGARSPYPNLAAVLDSRPGTKPRFEASTRL